MGLRSRFLGILLVLIVLPMLTLGGIGFWAFNKWNFNNALERVRIIGESVASSFAYDIELKKSSFLTFRQNIVLISGVRDYFDSPTRENLGRVHSEFKQFVESIPNMVEIGLYDPEGRLVEESITRSSKHDTPFGFPDILPHVEWMSYGMKMNSVAFNDGSKAYRIYMKITDENNRIIGYAVAQNVARIINGLLNNNATQDMYFFVSDASGNIVVRSPKLPVESVPPQWWDIAANQGDQQNFHEINIGKKPYLINMREIRPRLWVVSLLNIDSFYRESRHVLIMIMPVVALLIFFTALFFYLKFSSLIIYPIEKLIRATQRISSGDYRPDIDISTVDEVGELADAFRSMGEQLQESGEKIRQLAFYDPLTSLPNRETLLFSLNNLIDISERNNSLLGVLFIDLDDFKKVNDRLGHAAGDELLVVIGERLTHCLRSCDVVSGSVDFDTKDGNSSHVSRRGGDEFNAVISNAKNARDIALIAERLITDINEPIMLNGSPIGVGASIGVAIYPVDGTDAETLLHNADLAMYQAKAMGKNKYSLFTQAINAQVHERLEMEQRMRDALQHSEFQLYFQPKILLKNMTTVGFEALIRWKNSDDCWISPAEFIPLAEESQLIHDIGRWIIAEAFDHIQAWQDQLPKGVRVAINISAKQMAQESFAENFISLAEQFGAPLNRIEIELTETSILNDEVLVIQHLHHLREAGVKVSLDDFGTGYSSLTFLRNLPIDRVKIDRSFVSRLEEDNESKEIIASLLDLCKKLSLETVAEGVETRAQVAYLSAHGCTEGQGYLFAHPLPADKVLDYLSTSEYMPL